MLHRLLQLMKNTEQPLSSIELSRKLGIEPSALEGMLAYWIRKGRVRVESGDCSACTPEGQICPSCPAPIVGSNTTQQLVHYRLIDRGDSSG